MQVFPPFMWTRSEIERSFPVGSAEREQAIKSLEHSYTMYDYYGKHIPHINERENLLDEIRKRDAYIIDTNSVYKDRLIQHTTKAFIITATLSRELPKPDKLIFDERLYGLGNIFQVGPISNWGRVFIDRIDEPFRHVFDMQKFDDGLNKESNLFAQQKRQHSINNAIGKDEIITDIWVLFLSPIGKHSKFLHSARACDLPRPDTIREIIEKLVLEVKQLLPNCRYNLLKSVVAARKSYQALLLKDKKIRTGFDDPQYVNVLGDMHLVGMAIYLGAKIMTEDVRLIEMANYAGIECDIPPPVT